MIGTDILTHMFTLASPGVLILLFLNILLWYFHNLSNRHDEYLVIIIYAWRDKSMLTLVSNENIYQTYDIVWYTYLEQKKLHSSLVTVLVYEIMTPFNLRKWWKFDRTKSEYRLMLNQFKVIIINDNLWHAIFVRDVALFTFILATPVLANPIPILHTLQKRNTFANVFQNLYFCVVVLENVTAWFDLETLLKYFMKPCENML